MNVRIDLDTLPSRLRKFLFLPPHKKKLYGFIKEEMDYEPSPYQSQPIYLELDEE